MSHLLHFSFAPCALRSVGRLLPKPIVSAYSPPTQTCVSLAITSRRACAQDMLMQVMNVNVIAASTYEQASLGDLQRGIEARCKHLDLSTYPKTIDEDCVKLIAPLAGKRQRHSLPRTSSGEDPPHNSCCYRLTNAMATAWTAPPTKSLVDHRVSRYSEPRVPLVGTWRGEDWHEITAYLRENRKVVETDWSCNYLSPAAGVKKEQTTESVTTGGQADSAANGSNCEGADTEA